MSRCGLLVVLAAAPALGQQPGADRFGDPLPAGAVARVGTVRLRQPGEVPGLALSPDGKLLVTSGGGLSLRVWDATTGALVRTVPPPAAPPATDRALPVSAELAVMAFPADSNRWLYVLDQVGVFRECDLSDGTWNEPVARTDFPPKEHGYRQAGGKVSPDRTHFLYTPYDYDGSFTGIEVFAVGKNKPIARIEDPGFGRYGRAGSASADNRLLAAPLETGAARVWDVSTGTVVATRPPPVGSFISVSLSPDGKSLVGVCGTRGRGGSVTRDPRTLVGWDRATGAERFRVADWESFGVAHSPDGGRLVGIADGDVLVADPATGKLLHRLRGHGLGWLMNYAFSADGRRLATGGRDGTAIVWDLAAGKPALDFDSPRGPVTLLAFSPDGKTLFAGGEDHAGGLWEANTGRRLHRLTAADVGFLHAAVFTPDSKQVVLGYGGGGTRTGTDWKARLWGVADGKLVREYPGHTDRVDRLAVSPDGNQLVTRDWGKRVRLWNLHTGERTREIEWAPYNASAALVFPRPNELIGASGGDVAEAVELLAGKPLGRLALGRSLAVTLSPDGRLAAVWDRGSGREVRIVEVASGKAVQIVADAGSRRAVAFSADGRTLAVASGEAVRLYAVATGERTRELRGHPGGVAGVAFSPDGKRLATGGHDSTALVWDLTADR